MLILVLFVYLLCLFFSPLTKEIMWHFDQVAGVYTTGGLSVVTPCWWTSRDKMMSVLALTVLVTPCKKKHLLLYTEGIYTLFI